MAQNLPIVLTADPSGPGFQDIIVNDTSIPGTFMEIVPATAPVGGRFKWRARSSANGAQDPVAILINLPGSGQGVTTAYTSGDKGMIYWPRAGDELNAVVAESSGTGTASQNAIGDRLSINDSGYLIAATSNQKPFYLLDRTGLSTYTTALKWVQFLGCYL